MNKLDNFVLDNSALSWDSATWLLDITSHLFIGPDEGQIQILFSVGIRDTVVSMSDLLI